MLAKVIIKRKIVKGREKMFFSLLKELRHGAMTQDGYITGETLIGTDNANRVLVISTWETIEDWKRWKQDKNIEKIDSRLNELQEEQTQYEAYVLSKYRAAAAQGFPLPLQKQEQ